MRDGPTYHSLSTGRGSRGACAPWRLRRAADGLKRNLQLLSCNRLALQRVVGAHRLAYRAELHERRACLVIEAEALDGTIKLRERKASVVRAQLNRAGMDTAGRPKHASATRPQRDAAASLALLARARTANCAAHWSRVKARERLVTQMTRLGVPVLANSSRNAGPPMGAPDNAEMAATAAATVCVKGAKAQI